MNYTDAPLTKKLFKLTNWVDSADGYSFGFLTDKLPAYCIYKEENGSYTMTIEAPFFFDGKIIHGNKCDDEDCECNDIEDIESTNPANALCVAIIELIDQGVIKI